MGTTQSRRDRLINTPGERSAFISQRGDGADSVSRNKEPRDAKGATEREMWRGFEEGVRKRATDAEEQTLFPGHGRLTEAGRVSKMDKDKQARLLRERVDEVPWACACYTVCNTHTLRGGLFTTYRAAGESNELHP
jgi:hypothetical protein